MRKAGLRSRVPPCACRDRAARSCRTIHGLFQRDLETLVFGEIRDQLPVDSGLARTRSCLLLCSPTPNELLGTPGRSVHSDDEVDVEVAALEQGHQGPHLRSQPLVVH